MPPPLRIDLQLGNGSLRINYQSTMKRSSTFLFPKTLFAFPDACRNPIANPVLKIAVILLGLQFFPRVSADEEKPTYEPATFFRTLILPILEDRCFECHSEAEGSYDGGLALDTKAGWVEGGDHGPAVAPFNLQKSPLIRSIRSEDPAILMPPDGKISREEIALLSTWILLGAPDPRPE